MRWIQVERLEIEENFTMHPLSPVDPESGAYPATGTGMAFLSGMQTVAFPNRDIDPRRLKSNTTLPAAQVLSHALKHVTLFSC